MKAKHDKQFARNGKTIIWAPKETYKITPRRNAMRAIWDSMSKAPVQCDEEGKATTETIEAYIRYSIRADNLQWILCLDDLHDCYVELFALETKAAASQEALPPSAQAATDAAGGGMARVDEIRARKAADAAAQASRVASGRIAELLETIRLRENLARESSAMLAGAIAEHVLQYWRTLRHFHKSGEAPVLPKLPDPAAFNGERLYRTMVRELREDVQAQSH